jgi:hypothetical protein
MKAPVPRLYTSMRACSSPSHEAVATVRTSSDDHLKRGLDLRIATTTFRVNGSPLKQ